jgi:SAM-dependent methyltransferase
MAPTVAAATPELSADPREHNRSAWDQRAACGEVYTRPLSDEHLARPKINPWLPEGFAGKRMLLLAAGGGRQSLRYAVAGAVVTVVDISDEMLAIDRAEAARRGLDIRAVQTSMDNLSMFAPESFDIVNQPVSTCYVPDLLPVYRAVARVLVPGGVYLSQHKQPASLQCRVQPGAGRYPLVEPYYRKGPLPPAKGNPHREAGTIEFLHRWEDLIGGLCRSGFVVEDVSEPKHARRNARPGSFGHLSLYAAPYVRIKARRLDR